MLWRVLGVYGSGGLRWVSLFLFGGVSARGCGRVINAKRDGSVNAGGSQWQYTFQVAVIVVAGSGIGLDQELGQIGRDLAACVCVCVRAWNVAKVDRQAVAVVVVVVVVVVGKQAVVEFRVAE